MSELIDPPKPEAASEPQSIEPSGVPPNVAACLACVFPLAGGLIFLSLEKKNAFVRFYAMQSVYSGGAIFVCYIVLHVIAWVIARIPVLGWVMSWMIALIWFFVALLWVVIYLVTIVKSITGKEWEIPYLGRLARQQLGTEQVPGDHSKS